MFRSVNFLLFSALFSCLFSLQAVTPFKDGEKVVFLGDSITHGGDFICWTQILYQLRMPGRIRLENAGISGDSAPGGFRRLDYDVLNRKPDRVFIMFGMNDINLNLYAKGGMDMNEARMKILNNYENYINRICGRLKEAGITAVLITPTPYNQYGKGNPSTYNEAGLGTAAGILRKTAQKRGLELLDFYAPMTEVIKKHPKYSPMRYDKVHPNALGQLLMAYYLCKDIGLDGKIADVSINAADGKVKKAEHAKISRVKRTKNGKKATGISFEYSVSRLPFIPEKLHAGIDTLVPFTADLNTESLQITGLEQGKYQLLADGAVIGSFTASELARGINLAVLDTPARKQAQKFFAHLKEIKSCTQLLRSVVQGDRFVRAVNGDVNDMESCFKSADKWFKIHFIDRKGGNKKYYSIVIKQYKENKKKVPETQKKLEAAYEKLYQENRTVSCKIELKKQ